METFFVINMTLRSCFRTSRAPFQGENWFTDFLRLKFLFIEVSFDIWCLLAGAKTLRCYLEQWSRATGRSLTMLQLCFHTNVKRWKHEIWWYDAESYSCVKTFVTWSYLYGWFDFHICIYDYFMWKHFSWFNTYSSYDIVMPQLEDAFDFYTL